MKCKEIGKMPWLREAFLVRFPVTLNISMCALASGSSDPGSNPGRGHCVVFLYKREGGAVASWLMRSTPDIALCS